MMNFRHIIILALISAVINLVFVEDAVRADEVVIGVLAPMGQEKAVKMWQPTLDYLSEKNPDYSFVLLPATKNQLTEAVKQQKVDFFLTNTGHYVELEAEFGATRILTLRRSWKGQSYSQWGSVIFALQSNTNISGIDDIEAKRFAAVSPGAFAGFQVAFRELLAAGVMSKKDFDKIIFTGFPHDSPLKAVYEGKADTGTVPTGVLEEAIDSGKYQPGTFRVINQKSIQHFPFLASTQLYPLWPLVKSRHASEKLAENIVANLLQIPDEHIALRAGRISGWTVPLDYSDIHNLMREIKAGPYKDYGDISLIQFLHQYWQWLVITLVMFVMGMLTILYIARLNSQLTDAQVNLERKISERTEDLKNVNLLLHDEIQEQQRLHDQLERNAEDEEILGRLMALSLRLMVLEDYLNASLKLLSDTLPWFKRRDNACVFLARHVGDEAYLEMVAGINISEQRKETCSMLPFGKCLCGEAASSRAIVFASEVDDRHHIKPELDEQHGHYCVPIEKEEKLLGVLMIQLPFNHQSSTHEFLFLKRIADVLSMGISRHQAEDEIEYYAYHDTLTNLPNRRLLLDRLNQEYNQADRSHEFGAVIYIDLDNFKTLNDSLGHPVGDDLLCQMAKRLTAYLRKDDTVARLGGDEFVVILPSLGNTVEACVNNAGDTAEKIRERLREKYILDGHEYHATVSLGIAIYPNDQHVIEDVLKQADSALYEAKKHGRDRAYFYQQSMQEAATKRLALERDIRKGIKEDQFFMYFQPQLDVNGVVTGAESLLRWKHPVRGLVSPGEFIPVAEDSGLIIPLGNLVLDKVFEFMLSLNNDDVPSSFDTLSVNISPKQFRQPDFVDVIKEKLSAYKIDPSRLMFEVTEGVLVDNIEDVAIKMQRLKELSIRFSIDDFGTGYSSMMYLKNLPLGELKIDQSFVCDLPEKNSAVAIIEAIISIAEHLGLRVVAEGVEKAKQLHFLESIGCRYFQGFYFDAPLSESEFKAKYFVSPNQRMGD